MQEDHLNLNLVNQVRYQVLYPRHVFPYPMYMCALTDTTSVVLNLI